MSNEFELIDRLARIVGRPSKGVLVGIGDDAAVIERPARNLAVTVDMQVEGIHFRKDWIGPEDLGRRALAVNLSDLAAMGATPRFALVSLGVSDGTTDEYLERVYRGLNELALCWGVAVIGGNISRSPERLLLDIVVHGEVSGVGLRRVGARPGDSLWVTGWVGRAAAGRKSLERLGPSAETKFPELVGAFLRPEARVAEGLALVDRAGVTSAIDISDGLASELGHLAKASGVGFVLDEGWLERDQALAEGAKWLGESARDLALHGGEDYELLFTAGADSESRWPFARRIGRVVEASPGILWGSQPIPVIGWDHLKKPNG